LRGDDFGLFAFEHADFEGLVLLQDFLSVKVVEGLRGILSGNLAEDDFAAGVGVEEVGDIVDFVVDDDPEVLLGGVLWHGLEGMWGSGVRELETDLLNFFPGQWSLHGGRMVMIEGER
jgi:hypothetical protein